LSFLSGGTDDAPPDYLKRIQPESCQPERPEPESFQVRRRLNQVVFDTSHEDSQAIVDESQASDDQEKIAAKARCLQLQKELCDLGAKCLDAENKVQKLEAQAKLDKEIKEASDSARESLAEQIEVHKKAAEEANAKLAKVLATSTQSPTTAQLSSTPLAPGMKVYRLALCGLVLVSRF
jgi:hypothetical protein